MPSWIRNTFGPWALGRWAPLVILATFAAAGAAAAAGYALTAPHRYRATAQLIVSPVPAGDATFNGIDVLRDTGGKRTAAASAAALVRTPLVADAVRALLGLHRSRDALLNAIHVRVAPGSDVVEVTAEDTSSEGAAQLANAFVDTLVNQRSATFQSEVAAAVRRYAQQYSDLAPADRTGLIGRELSRRLVELRTLQNQPDPSVAHAGQAAPPTSSSWPNVGRLVAIGAGIGAALGAVAALALVVVRRGGRRPDAAAPAAYDRPMDHAVEGREADVALERLVDGIETRFAARESALLARERDLQATLDELRAAQAAAAGTSAAEADLERRERELEERLAAVTKRELELARRAAELAVQEREAEERAREPEPEPVRPVLAADPAAPRPAIADGGSYNLLRLERLVEERSADFPDKAEEWASYLYFLREYAAPDGSVPASFDWLIQDTFAELVS
jgi:capsular polysaccharide biosynthesis protein